MCFGFHRCILWSTSIFAGSCHKLGLYIRFEFKLSVVTQKKLLQISKYQDLHFQSKQWDGPRIKTPSRTSTSWSDSSQHKLGVTNNNRPCRNNAIAAIAPTWQRFWVSVRLVRRTCRRVGLCSRWTQAIRLQSLERPSRICKLSVLFLRTKNYEETWTTSVKLFIAASTFEKDEIG